MGDPPCPDPPRLLTLAWSVAVVVAASALQAPLFRSLASGAVHGTMVPLSAAALLVAVGASIRQPAVAWAGAGTAGAVVVLATWYLWYVPLLGLPLLAGVAWWQARIPRRPAGWLPWAPAQPSPPPMSRRP